MRTKGYKRRMGLYRSHDGVIFGVCKGLANHFDLKVSWIRIFMVIVLIITGLWPVVLLYIIAALIMKPEPVKRIDTEDEQEFYDSYTYSRQRAVHRLKRRFQALERRIRRLEDSVTTKEFDWDRKLNG